MGSSNDKSTGPGRVLGSNNETKTNAISIPQINLPKGGGALRGIDEKFSVNAANGTASFSIPLPITPGRNGFQPALALNYNSGAGNSPFGLGWNVDIPMIQRKTDKKLPQYRDYDDSDVFIFSGAEDLVPKMKEENGQWIPDQEVSAGYKIKRYRPRIEGLFARIEKIEVTNNANIYWRVTTRDNIVTIFGRNSSCRIADPDTDKKIFQWLPELSYNDKGSCILFEYKEEDLQNVASTVFEKNRVLGLSKTVNRYLKRIKYGNIQPYYPDYTTIDNIYSPPIPLNTEFLFELVFDYGEHATNEVTETTDWSTRSDPFSEYRAGFEIRTRRICKRFLMFHHFTNREFGSAANDERIFYLVRSLDLEFESSSLTSPQKSEVTYLKSIKETGYKKNGSSYDQRSFPPIDFSYQLLNWNRDVKTITPENIIHSPVGLTNNYQWVDLYNEGIPGILTEQADGWYYKSNLGGNDNSDTQFTRAQLVSPKPSLKGLSNGTLQLQDIDADGNKQIVSLQPGLQGYFELSDDNEWNNFQTFREIPLIDWQDPNTRLVDLNGDGKADILITEDNLFGWYGSMGKKGYENKKYVANERDEEKGPAIVFSDDKQTIFLADMCGDGLTDIVRIRNGEICYWPNLGYGRFGAKVTMSNAPLFDQPDLFNPSYLHLADVSGTGATDILYLGKNKFSAWLNLSGNAWSDTCEIDPFFSTESPNQISVVDLLGNGTSCIVWSSPLPANSNAPMRYIDLMGGKKPHVMIGCKNNFGKETSFEYKSSSQYYIEDKKSGTPWITKLPFPVQCLSKVVVKDTVSALRFSNQYKYHHGYYDHAEREFRGFGMVEQTDTEEFKILEEANAANGTELQFHEPPVLTKTWFHLGAYFRHKKILEHYAHEYWYKHPDIINLPGLQKEYSLPGPPFADDLSMEELIEAHRACKGMVLRQEVFSLDGKAQQLLPYTVATHNCNIRKVQPATGSHKAVFMVNESEAITYSYERNPNDPRIAHSLNIEFDDMGNVLKNAAVVYPRQTRPTDLRDNRIWDKQDKQHIIFSENSFTEDIETTAAYRLRLPFETKTFELGGAQLSPGKKYYSIANFNIPFNEIEYEEEFTDGIAEKRLIEHIKTIYLSDDVENAMPHGQHGSLGLTYESYQLAFTEGLLDSIYKTGNDPSKVNNSMLENDAKYFKTIENGKTWWWIRSGTMQYLRSAAETAADARQRFYYPLIYTDPFDSVTKVEYDSNYLLLKQTEDELENIISVERYDYRTLSATKVKDMNGNITEASIDILGLLAGIALMSKGNEGDDPNGFTPDVGNNQLESFFNPASINDQVATAKTLLANATSRLLYDFSKTPCVAATIVREQHYITIVNGQPVTNANPKVQFSFEYSDGLGNVILKKVRAEGGEAPYRDQDGNLVRLANGDLDKRQTDNRWVGNGRTILNNKGKPVKQYEPYFIEGHSYETESALREAGVTPVLHYDAVGRLVRTEMPDGTFSKIVFDSWKQITYDAIDTVLDSSWYNRYGRPDPELAKPGEKEKQAAWFSAIIADTPATAHFDSLGRPFVTVQYNRSYRVDESNMVVDKLDDYYYTFTELDIEGNISKVVDACNNTVMSYKYDMLGHQVYQNSMDAGERWLLNDCMGKPTYAWNSKDQMFLTEYDEMHRPLTVSLIADSSTTITDRFKYCDTKNLSAADLLMNQGKNVVGKLIEQYDNAGVIKMSDYDFKGNLLNSSKELCKKFDTIPDWVEPISVIMTGEIFYSSSEFDALNRPVRIITPYTTGNDPIPASEIIPEYNDANLLNAVSAKIRGSDDATYFVRNIEYDEKGQRKSIEYGNETITEYTYDEKTFRLTKLLTTKGDQVFQELYYTYDAGGNITHIYDNAHEAIFFRNNRIEALSEYYYDAIYQLLYAKGREHIGQNDIDEMPDYGSRNGFNYRNYSYGKNDGQAVRDYAQYYEYDPVGNIMKMQHAAGLGSWTRKYWYNNKDADRNELNVPSTDIKNNRLLQTQVGVGYKTPYHYDIHGNMTDLTHLSEMRFDHKDQLCYINLGGGGEAYYGYDSSGQRIRKVVIKDQIEEERIYLGGFEIFRKRENGGDVVKQVETLHIMDDTRRIAMVDTPVFTDDDEDELVIRYIYSNYLGSASMELNEDAETISYEEYHPYGTTSLYVTNTSIRAAAKRYRYTGMERDEESGMAYHTARYYLPWLGRWLSADPEGLVDGLNLYRYVRNNPNILLDPLGTQPTKAPNFINLDEWGLPIAPDVDLGKVTPVKPEAKSANNIDNYKTFGAYGVNPLVSEYEGIRFVYEDNTSKDIPLSDFGTDEINEAKTPRIMQALSKMESLRGQAIQTNLFFAELVNVFGNLIAASVGMLNAKIPPLSIRRKSSADYFHNLGQGKLDYERVGKIPPAKGVGVLSRSNKKISSEKVMIYAVDKDGSFIYSERGDPRSGQKHDQLTLGGPAKRAGEMKFDRKTNAITINNFSGRFRTQNEQTNFKSTAKYLKSMGFKVKIVNKELHD